MLPRTRCLIAFDAFGTLFSPRSPVAHQYIGVSQAFLRERYPNNEPPTLSQRDVGDSFRLNYKQISNDHANFGRDTGLDPQTWWKRLIKSTLDPFLNDVIKSKEDWDILSERLWQNFSSLQGYALHEDARKLLKHLKQKNQTQDRMQYIVGVVTNSDPRVSKILTSMGLTVSPVGLGVLNSDSKGKSSLDKDNDFQFVITSYDVGHRKPRPEIFKAAEDTARTLLKQESNNGSEQLLKLYIGDDYDFDGVGAINAGWNAILVEREDMPSQNESFLSSDTLKYPNKAVSEMTNTLYLERMKSLWPFDPQVLKIES